MLQNASTLHSTNSRFYWNHACNYNAIFYTPHEKTRSTVWYDCVFVTTCVRVYKRTHTHTHCTGSVDYFGIILNTWNHTFPARAVTAVVFWQVTVGSTTHAGPAWMLICFPMIELIIVQEQLLLSRFQYKVQRLMFTLTFTLQLPSSSYISFTRLVLLL